ncbi:MAG: flavin reductase family protein [Pseudanabaena sp. ELA607]|jgi:flavin reductase (DIM6/NTAB) family NADH-FMN oxidoreductase RutF
MTSSTSSTIENPLNESLGEALGAIPSGLFIVLVQQDGKTSTMLASWVQQAGFEPPSVTLVTGKGRAIAESLTIGAKFTISILEKGQGKLIGHFAKGFAPEVDPLAGIDIAFGHNGQPYLIEAIAYLEATVTRMMDADDHNVLLAMVTDGNRFRDGEVAVHTRKNGFRY